MSHTKHDPAESTAGSWVSTDDDVRILYETFNDAHVDRDHRILFDLPHSAVLDLRGADTCGWCLEKVISTPVEVELPAVGSPEIWMWG